MLQALYLLMIASCTCRGCSTTLSSLYATCQDLWNRSNQAHKKCQQKVWKLHPISCLFTCFLWQLGSNYWHTIYHWKKEWPKDMFWVFISSLTWLGNNSEGREKYLRELSITPVGYFTGAIKNHSRAVSHRNYFAWPKWRISEEQEWFSQG
jgi:hypothetical protein